MNKKLFIFLSFILVIISGGIIITSSKPGNQTSLITDQINVQSTSGLQVDIPPGYVGKYTDYTPTAFAAATGKKRVYFFHATWCPTCKAADRELVNNANKLPANVVVFKTDYDNQIELKKKYGITYQHTFVYVDESGNEFAKWNGGGIQELIDNTK